MDPLDYFGSRGPGDSQNPMNLKNKKIAVIGLGKSGFAAAKFLLAQKARVRVSDGSEKKEVLENAGYLRGLGVDVQTGRHTEEFLREVDQVVTSPGVPKESLPLEFARRKKIPVISEIELASYFCKGRIIAVTGSNGKTTTCNLLHRILVEGGHHSVLCGNVGYSFLEAVSEITATSTVVLELSSFQLEDSPTFRPSMAVVLNISANHLDRHKTIENYTKAKEMIFKNQKAGDHLVLNFDDLLVRAMAKKARSQVHFFSQHPLMSGVFWQDHQIQLRRGRVETMLLDPADFKLQGMHNMKNIMAAASVATLLKVPREKIQKSVSSFKTLEHRIEPLGQVRGVRFVNDSKSTTVESTRAAILASESPLILLAGGRDKGAPFGEIENLVRDKVRTAVLYGEAREKIAAVWSSVSAIKTEKDFYQAVKLAFEEAHPGDTILLSPMCTSFDQFTSYEHRGEVFKKIFHELENQ